MSDELNDDAAELEQDAVIEPTTSETEPKTPTETDELKSAMAELARNVTEISKPKEPEKTELTAEQKEELWAVYNPEKARPDFMRKFFRMNPEATPEEVKEAKELFDDMHKGIVKQAVTGAKNLFEVELAKIREETKGLSDYVQEQRAEKTRNKFYAAYPVLKDAKFAKVIAAHANILRDKDFKNENEYFKALADGAAETIKGFIPEFEVGQKEETKPAGTTPRLPRTSAGGTGGNRATHTPTAVPANGNIDELE